ncbi:hypothetical protein C1646_757181 [Rhizophagus diaphanus]|nr:hypothetical protein C1646_757181 [Rhizophagus diaphanus] [Rhizophagus sp. MUCL 43196]
MKFILMFILIIIAFNNIAAIESLDWKRDESRTLPLKKTLKNSPLVSRALVCPSGTYECKDSEGGCCSYGTTCLPNFKCSSGKPIATSNGIILEKSSNISQILSIVVAYLIIPGAEQCLSEIKFLRCDGRVHDKNLTMLTKVCKSIKGMQLFLYDSYNNYGISNTFVQPQTQILASFVNLKTLILNNCEFDRRRWYFIESVSLPSLQFLDANTINTESLTSLIKNSGENLTKIRIFNLLAFSNGNYNKKIIQAICQSCLNLMHLELYYLDANVLELEKLLTRCQYLNKLVFHFSSKFFSSNFFQDKFIIDWGNLFNILAASSPSSLFKFTFYFPVNNPELKSFDTWEGRHPIYKAKGVIKEFVYNFHEDDESKTTIKGAVKDLVAVILMNLKMD